MVTQKRVRTCSEISDLMFKTFLWVNTVFHHAYVMCFELPSIIYKYHCILYNPLAAILIFFVQKFEILTI